jgi:hypothetical protein
VEFTWDRAIAPCAVELDTNWQGDSNSGHTGARFNGGIDWKAEPDKLGELFEYLKTLWNLGASPSERTNLKNQLCSCWVFGGRHFARRAEAPRDNPSRLGPARPS